MLSASASAMADASGNCTSDFRGQPGRYRDQRRSTRPDGKSVRVGLAPVQFPVPEAPWSPTRRATVKQVANSSGLRIGMSETMTSNHLSQDH